MAKNSNFTAMLQKGMMLEDITVNYLIDAYPDYNIIPTHDFKTGSGKGPRILRKGKKDVILPDIMMVHWNTRHTMLVEVKRKKKTFGLPGHGTTKFAGVEEYKVQDYRHAANIMNADLYFAVGIDTTHDLHMIPDQHFHIHNFNNQYSRVDTCCIEIDDDTVVDNY